METATFELILKVNRAEESGEDILGLNEVFQRDRTRTR